MAHTSSNRLSVTGSQHEALPSFAEATATPSSVAASAAASVHASPAPILDSRVVLRVGERQFFTTRATLAESHLLTTLLSTDATHGGEYFLDADPDMFAEILRFLRTRRFPLYHDPATGYDAARYLELQVAAQFYQIPTLEMWLAERRYLGAMQVRSEYKGFTLYGTDQIVRMHELCWSRTEQGRVLTITERKTKAWACPVKLWRHDGDQNSCFKAKCLTKLPPGQTHGLAIMRVLDLTVLTTRMEVRESVLSAGAYPEGPPPYQGGDDDD